MAMENMTHMGQLVYRNGGREYITPYPYTPEVFMETCRMAGWAYRQVPLIPIDYEGYYVRYGVFLYLLDMDTPKYGNNTGGLWGNSGV